TTVDIGDGADPHLVLPASGSYRIIASRGTEWSTASQRISTAPGDMEPGEDQSLDFTLYQVAPATGYVGSDHHVHQIASPDSTVPNDLRIAAMVAEGVELFAATDHDYVADLQPEIAALGLTEYTRAMPGLEVTPFAYGHFNAWPIAIDMLDPSRGAVDWARGTAGYAMIPGEIFAALSERGAEVIQVNHPRSTFPGSFLTFFDRAGLAFDYGARQIVGDFTAAPVPNDWLRLPETSLWSDGFDALEVWVFSTVGDSNDDGVRELTSLDLNLRDWFNFLSLGFVVTPMGNSDSHGTYSQPNGLPRTYVRVADDSPAALASGAVVDEALATLSGRAPRDVVISNGPHIQVTAAGLGGSAIGRVIPAPSGAVTLEISVVSAGWAEFDTIELFANATPDLDAPSTALQPLLCFTSRAPTDIQDNDVCATTPAGAQPLVVDRVPVGPGADRYQAALQVTIASDDIVNRAGASGDDAWLVIRARGQRAIFPLSTADLVGEGDDEVIDILVAGEPGPVDAVLRQAGLPATAFTAAIFIDFDGGGYTAPFSPQ
ncbi:MAG: CehA/McbA family metallohydrolase, partial [Myxococcota bacterium]